MNKNKSNKRQTMHYAGGFADQGGTASSNPSVLKRWLVSKAMSLVASEHRIQKKRQRFEKHRQQKGLNHRVDYFHQIDDPYSHLALQKLQQLQAQYDIDIHIHWVAGPSGDNSPEPDLLAKYACIDCKQIASYYQCEFPDNASLPTREQVITATNILVAQLPADTETASKKPHTLGNIAEVGLAVGDALWRGQDLTALAKQYGSCSQADAECMIKQGSAHQAKLGHYSGAMFYYGGEWYWGVDRLFHLEQRLIELSANITAGQPLVAPRPAIDTGNKTANSTLTLEFYASLRSPYTAIIFDRCVEMCEASGVQLVLRPVLPMVMRGITLTHQKGVYIFFDTAREAGQLGLGAIRFADPIGEPVRRAYSLYPWAREQGKAIDFFRAFFQAAFFTGVNTNSDKGLRTVVENAGLSWAEACEFIDNNDWQQELEENRLAMYQCQLWGVPSFKLLNNNGETILGCWGQDRLWLVADKIKQQLTAK